MYNREQLTKYPYFNKVLDGHRIADVLDPLTGVVNRTSMMDFVRSLIDQDIPFTFGMIDLDNFKYINDNYGHSVGDEILKCVSSALADYLGDFGLAGRFGGDELLFINFRDLEYEDKKVFCTEMFSNYKVLRRTYKVDNYELFVTGTLGCATYPINTTDYNELFSMIDKTLYRGKSKGRNCYIIYVEEKHRNIEIVKLKNSTLFDTFRNLSDGFDSAPELHDKLRAVYEVLKNDIHISDMYYAGADKMVKSVVDNRLLGQAPDIDKVLSDEIYSTNDLEEIQNVAPIFYSVLKGLDAEAVLIIKVRMGNKIYGYLMCAEPHTLRIWQESEYAIMFLLARMLSGYLTGRRMELN